MNPVPLRPILSGYLLAFFLIAVTISARAQTTINGVVKVGGFRCLDLKPLRNDSSYDLYQVGYWSRAGFRMDIWKRHGVPFWYRPGTGDIRVAGPEFKADYDPTLTSAESGAVASADSDGGGNGAISNANDGDPNSYWYAGDWHPRGRLQIMFRSLSTVHSVRFKPWNGPRHAPRDYTVDLILPHGGSRRIASVQGEKRVGEWIEISGADTPALGVALNVTATMENEHGPVIYEMEATGQPLESQAYPQQVTIPARGLTGKELHILGSVGTGFPTTPDVETPVGRFVINYANGTRQVVPLIAGRNVASTRYGHFVPDAEVAGCIPDGRAARDKTLLTYHLAEQLPVEPKKQFMLFSTPLSQPRQPIKSVTFQCTRPRCSLVLLAMTVQSSGPRMNILRPAGRLITPVSWNPPPALPRETESATAVSLDGQWQFKTDPADRGIRHRYFALGNQIGWQPMPVPSQWYVQGVDYHGVAWYRRTFKMSPSLTGEVVELNFGGVDYDARVWLNGKYVGRHTGAFASWKLDITAALNRTGPNSLVVRVDSPIDPGFTTQKTIIKGNSMDDICMPYFEEGCQGGIFRSVKLTSRGDVGLADVWTSTQLNGDLTQAQVTLNYRLTGAGESHLHLHWRMIGPAGTKSLEGDTPAKTEADSGATDAVQVKLAHPALWYPWEQGRPDLYTLKLELYAGDRLLDTHVSRVGIREVTFDTKQSCVNVNHHRLFIKGMLNDDVHWMSMMNRDAYRQRIQLQKDANLNLIRMVGHESSPDMYDLCDDMGMLIWQEMPLQWAYSRSAPVHKDILSVVSETVRQCRPHASVIGWSAWNEGGQTEFSQQVVDLMQSLDGTRPMTKACGGGDFDIHIYPNLASNLGRYTPFWSGIKVGFVSEVGAYGQSSPAEMKEMLGDELFRFDTADYFWETWNSYRYCDGPVFTDAPNEAPWPTQKVRAYALSHAAASERWLQLFMKYMFENFRAQRFNPTTSAIHCRFDDPMPSAFLGIVNFNGHPRKAYGNVKESCQQVLPILMFDYQGAEDVRVVNEYWFKSWRGCRLQYRFTDGENRVYLQGERQFDLPADATVAVLNRGEIGDVWGRAGLRVSLRVLDAQGHQLSKNSYDLTQKELRDFPTCVYPVAPEKPYGALMVTTAQAVADDGWKLSAGTGAYGGQLLASKRPGAALKWNLSASKAGDYLIRVAASSGPVLRLCRMDVDGKKAVHEEYPYVDSRQGITRNPYAAQRLSWFQGWRTHLTAGTHTLRLTLPSGKAYSGILVDAIALQPAP